MVPQIQDVFCTVAHTASARKPIPLGQGRGSLLAVTCATVPTAAVAFGRLGATVKHFMSSQFTVAPLIAVAQEGGTPGAAAGCIRGDCRQQFARSKQGRCAVIDPIEPPAESSGGTLSGAVSGRAILRSRGQALLACVPANRSYPVFGWKRRRHPLQT